MVREVVDIICLVGSILIHRDSGSIAFTVFQESISHTQVSIQDVKEHYASGPEEY